MDKCIVVVDRIWSSTRKELVKIRALWWLVVCVDWK